MRNMDDYALVVALTDKPAKVKVKKLDNTLVDLEAKSLDHTMGGALSEVEGQSSGRHAG